ncbi:hypothetical protein [Labrys neptuniae]
MNGEQMGVIREKAGRLLDVYGEFSLGDAKSKQVCVGYGVGHGTTCGFLCHFLMWRLGVKDRTRVNWNDPSRGLNMVASDNIRRIYLGGTSPFVTCASTAKGVKMLNPLVVGQRPQLGDIVFVFEPGGLQSTEHVFVFRKEERRGNELIWHTSEAGQPGAKGSTDARQRERRVLMSSRIDQPTFLNEVSEPDFRLRRSSNRAIIGWLDIGSLEYIDSAFEDAMKPVEMVV